MDKFLESYLKRAEEIIGERSPEEILYDNAIVEALNQGCAIHEALARAASQYPNEALQWDLNTIHDIAEHYDYLKQHAAIMEKLNRHKKD